MITRDQTIYSLFEDSIAYDEPYTAHLIYYAIKTGKVSLQESAAKLYDLPMTDQEWEEFRRMKAQNPLQLRPIKLYAIKRTRSAYVFYFARNEREVQHLHSRLYHSWETRIIYAHNQMIDRCLYFPETKETKTFRQLLWETVEFPAWVCELEG